MSSSPSPRRSPCCTATPRPRSPTSTRACGRASCPSPTSPDYRVSVAYDGGEPTTYDDPYRYLPTVGETDLHLINEGRHEQLWQVLGAKVRRFDNGVTGTSFAVWAPAAKGVRVKGDFNHWDGREHPMRQLGISGVWELFVPGIGSGTRYKFIILGARRRVA